MSMILKRRVEQQLWQQPVGTGWLVLKVSPQSLLWVEVYVNRQGVLCRIVDGKPVLPVELEPDDDLSSDACPCCGRLGNGEPCDPFCGARD